MNFPHSNHQSQVLLLVGEGHEISNTNKMKLLVCLSLQVLIELPEDQEQMWMNKTRVKMKVTVMMDQTLIRREIILSHTTTMPLMNRMTMSRVYLLKIGNGNLSQMIWKFLKYHIIMMGPMG